MSPQLDFIGIVVSDMAASLAFYRRLGLTFPPDAESAPHTEATITGGLRIALDTEETVLSFHPDWERPTSGGRVGLAFRCADPSDVDAVYAAIIDAGYRGELKPWDAPWGQRYATVADPDGNGVDLYAPLH
ncbi:VOC family protein [Nocardia sp. NPDC005366]|uniref:VOC family protein n=1 Tax=Nocardia sp. NPDC005366 TaxID=3156878 RepID=UPI0033A9B841